MDTVKETDFSNSNVVTDITIGLSDGLIVPFALVAGLSSGEVSASAIITTGIVATVIGSVAMGLGGYFTAASDMDHHHHEAEDDEVKDILTYQQKESIRQFYANLDLPAEVQQQATDEIIKDNEQWGKVMSAEIIVRTGMVHTPATSGFLIALSYLCGGLIVISPFFFNSELKSSLQYTAILAVSLLFIFGWVKSKLENTNPWLGALRLTIIGALAAGAAFFTGKLF